MKINIKSSFILLLLIMFFSDVAFAQNTDSKKIIIKDFDSCVAAGNKVLRSYPAKCVAPGIGIFTQIVPELDNPKTAEPLFHKKLCKDLCADGNCDEIVCAAEGCPCPESPDSCPTDCK